MTRLLPALALCATALPLALAAPALAQQEGPALDSAQEIASYAIGRRIGASLLQQDIFELDLEKLALGIAEEIEGKDLPVTVEEIQAAMQELQAQQDAVREARGQLAIEEGQSFLQENKDRAGVVVTESGLQYLISEAGEGEPPNSEQMVTVHYTGRLLDGTVFDSSVERGAPATFPVKGVIPGWQEALQLMRPGATWEVWIPSEIAYGARGAGADIGPNEVLNFTIQLIEISN
ncbi:FKBP-type peptidyl-prolyl cis-trans isomerase [Candidatus Rhodobacter oscarellae]|uniref:Peptidyl-prolyl cis-trans isomerase n=1 Tax=Candidatus Rhodobacter oscarellae TaxID=1675527 RepID=A0A0J9E3W8_9RHOB|nr:FKBP-type peptidyl-prolyl cis-trans isomerase [Candidatus Rhodobacter lobularis]KMW56539.1 FKBP-type peptidyl-prolyl cis-trans isomerase [Candidatus Rhodobacter lobularis]